MENAIIEHQPDRLSPAEVRDQVNHIQKIMQSVMKKDVHYGTIPGTPKPSLWKPGAEKLLSTFRLSCHHTIEDLSDHDHRRFRVTARLLTANGVFVCDGVGSASTEEEKHCWRAAVCDEEFMGTDEARRRVKYKKKKGGGGYPVNQVRTNPADLENTVMKMAAKRAMVAAVLIATAASDVFSQDIEDLPEGLDQHDDRPPIETPRERAPEPSETPPWPEDAKPPKATRKTKKAAKGGNPENVVVGVVETVTCKPTKGNDRYGIKIEATWYNTFSETFGAMAEDSKENGTPVSLEWKVTEFGNDVVNMEVFGG